MIRIGTKISHFECELGSHISDFQFSTFLESIPTPGFSRVSPKESKRMLVVPERSLDGF
jgi:hypothetical protein